MRFLSIRLTNYIGIYNGLGLYEINIDMRLCRNRIIIIRGDNGSGKSTLMKALSLFPDPNDSFIPGMPAQKVIELEDGQTLYRLVFVHGIKSNGDREVTKAYITKTFCDTVVELNENGNVSSFKDILYSELQLDANFAALSQLSNEDRGLADKKPAERKRFVNSIISSLETYNAIYKTLNKTSSNYKSMLQSVVAKLSVLGDEKVLTSDLDSVESQINQIQDMRDQSVVSLAKMDSTIVLLDPDGSIQLINSKLLSEIGLLNTEIAKITSIVDGMISANNIQTTNFEAGRQRIIDKKNSCIISNQIDKNTVESLLRQKEAEATTLNEKAQRLNALQSGHSYESLLETKRACEARIDAIESEFKAAGVEDISSISKEEYILAITLIGDLRESISSFKSYTDFETLSYVVSYYLSNGKLPDMYRFDIIEDLSSKKQSLEKTISDAQSEIFTLDSEQGLIDKLSKRPSNCSDDSCPFIVEAVQLVGKDPNNRRKTLSVLIEHSETELASVNSKLSQYTKINDAISKFGAIVRSLDKSMFLFKKVIPSIQSTTEIVDSIINGDNCSSYMDSLYSRIDLANQIDVYKNEVALLTECNAEIRVYESKAEAIESLLKDINAINASLNGIEDKITSINSKIISTEKSIAVLQESESVYDALIDKKSKLDKLNQQLADANARLDANNKKMSDINVCLEKSKALKADIAKYAASLAPLIKSRDKLVHSVQMMQEYKSEKERLTEGYEYIEVIKRYSSPTTGIQLVFMNLYMGKVISLANELLSLLFNGQYVIQPFVINESEFRIPCLGSGYLNDDISSMSSSQIGMISMILSFALLHHSSTKYNIIKLDEIDGPLDYNNRVFFMDVLNNIMNIMHTEQCIMISHNSELQVDNCDVILLKHDIDNTDYRRGNIIWSY